MKRVVITGLGVVAPNGVGVPAFTQAIKDGVSGIRHNEQLEKLQFSCQIAGMPQISDDLKRQYFTELELRGLIVQASCTESLLEWRPGQMQVFLLS